MNEKLDKMEASASKIIEDLDSLNKKEEMVKEYVQNLFKGQGSRPESSSTVAGRMQEENAAIIAVPEKPADEDTDQQNLGSREEANPDSPPVT